VRVQQRLAEREYHTSTNDAGLQAPNRVHNLRTYFEPSGIRVHDRTAAGSPQLLGLSLVGLGRGDDLTPVSPGEVTSDGSRVEINRPDLVEWYSNSTLGLEQGFTLAARPQGRGELAFELAVEHARAMLRGEQVIFTTAAGRRLAYDKLVVVDATGQNIAARLEVPDAGHVRLVVADAAASYPLTVDPLLSETVDAQIESDQGGAYLGISVSGAGDVNGDGYADVIVGSRFYDAGQGRGGAAFVFLGSTSGIADASPATASAQLESDQADAEFGYSVSGAGDVNGDGYGDVIVGARYYNAGLIREGAAFIFLGSASGIADGSPATAATQLESNQSFAHLGVSVSGAGDVNGDGYSDVIVGAHLYNAGLSEEGAAFVFLGSASGIADGNPATAATQLESNQDNAEFGLSVSGAGDVNGDGYADVIVGAPIYESVGTINAGAAFVFLGSASGVADGNPTTASARLTSSQLFGKMGFSVAAAGDVNGDGYADVIVGDYQHDAGEANEGAAFVFMGSAAGVVDGTPASAATQLESDQTGAELGYSVAGAGDVNGDGYADVVVGARRFAAGEAQEGAAFVFLGSAAGIADGNPASAMAQLELDQASASLGRSVAGTGDVNGDGFTDIVVGALLYDASEVNEGAAFVYQGGDAGGNPAVTQQRRGDGSGTPVEAGGAAFSNDRFGVDFFAHTAVGMERAKFEVEVCLSGLRFGDAACASQASPSWVTLGPNGAALSQMITGLAANELFSWRARALYTSKAAGDPPSAEPGPWFRLQGRATPGDIRTVPEPGIGATLLAGALFIAGWRKRNPGSLFSYPPRSRKRARTECIDQTSGIRSGRVVHAGPGE